jgi:hypothetical protein
VTSVSWFGPAHSTCRIVHTNKAGFAIDRGMDVSDARYASQEV